mmetsp:Transcript_19651/g.48673  ORF Transcript_19651/g.48673 Transcript_19651/m.48673 type:complete len:314 (+) Transcript_19651:1103-2044(+)
MSLSSPADFSVSTCSFSRRPRRSFSTTALRATAEFALRLRASASSLASTSCASAFSNPWRRLMLSAARFSRCFVSCLAGAPSGALLSSTAGADTAAASFSLSSLTLSLRREISCARPLQPPAPARESSSRLKSAAASPTSRLMMARMRSLSALTVAKRPLSRSARATASFAFSRHSAASFCAISAASAASATTSRHATSTCDSVRGSPSSLVPACAALSSVLMRAFSAFSRSSASVRVRFFLAISTIFDSRTSAVSGFPPHSANAVSWAISRSLRSSVKRSSWLRCVSSWTWPKPSQLKFSPPAAAVVIVACL